MALTVKRIAKLTAPGRYGDGHGLYLQVLAPTNRSWLLRYQRDGRERWLGLGPLHTVDLTEARERARKARLSLLDGIDPIERKRAERVQRVLEAAKNKTFAMVAQEYFAAHADEWNNAKHRQQFLNTLRDYVHPIIGALPVAAIDEPLVLKVLSPIWREKTVTAKRVRNRIAAVLDFAAAAGYRKGTNPARWEGHLEHLLAAPDKIAKPQHHPALPYVEIGAFMVELRKLDGIPARALEFTILTAARSGEVIGAIWDEIDLTAKTWTIPAARMKMAREHRVPLSARAVELLTALPREQGNMAVFLGARAGSAINSMALMRVLRRMGRDDITVHGFRSTFRDWAAERTAYPNHVLEMALAHTVGGVEAAYRRGDLFDKRRKLMDEWSRFCSTKVTATGKIVPMRA